MAECWCTAYRGDVETLIRQHGAEWMPLLGLWRLPADAWPELEAALLAMGARLEVAS